MNNKELQQNNDARIMMALAALYERDGRPPSYRELLKATGLLSTFTVHKCCMRLERCGLVKIMPGSRGVIPQLRIVAYTPDRIAQAAHV